MSLRQTLENDMRTALREREAGKTRLSVLRLALAAVKNLEIERRRALEEQEIVEVLSREVRGRRDVLPDYERAGRIDLVEKINQEIAILQQYLPRQMSDDEIRDIVAQRIRETGASGPRDMGKLMGPLMAELRGRADGAKVQAIVRELLARG